MTENFCTTERFNADHSIFGGVIDIEDFNTNSPNEKRISNQINAINKSNQRKEAEKYKHMTLEELKEMKIIYHTT